MPVTPPAIQPAPPAPGMPAQAPATSARKPKVIATAPTPTRVRRLPTPFLPRPTAKGAAGSGRRDRRHAAANPATRGSRHRAAGHFPARGGAAATAASARADQLHVVRRDAKIRSGRTVQTWEVEDGSYRIGSVSETTGVVNVLRSERRNVSERGEGHARRLAPDLFLMSRTRRGDNEVGRARFDWDGAHITWERATRRTRQPCPWAARIPELMYQLSLRLPQPAASGCRSRRHEIRDLRARRAARGDDRYAARPAANTAAQAGAQAGRRNDTDMACGDYRYLRCNCASTDATARRAASRW